jgi:small nuclear ribonucleoprotein (snRNP)-like protein
VDDHSMNIYLAHSSCYMQIEDHSMNIYLAHSSCHMQVEDHSMNIYLEALSSAMGEAWITPAAALPAAAVPKEQAKAASGITMPSFTTLKN